MKEIDVQPDDAGQRLDKFLMKSFPELPKSAMFKAIRNKKIKINRKRCQFDDKLEPHDTIQIFLPDDMLAERKKEIMQPTYPVQVVYEDEDIIIVNKPAGLLSIPDAQNQDSMIGRIQAYLMDKGEYDPNASLTFSPALISRLDRNTRGLVIAAKNARALRLLSSAVQNRQIHKYYKAKVDGVIPWDEMECRLFLEKGEDLKARIYTTPSDNRVNADSNIQVIKRGRKQSTVKVELLTGRFHQIRATLAYLGYPLSSDRKYGSKGNGTYFLQAYKVVIDCPGLYDEPLNVSL